MGTFFYFVLWVIPFWGSTGLKLGLISICGAEKGIFIKMLGGIFLARGLSQKGLM